MTGDVQRRRLAQVVRREGERDLVEVDRGQERRLQPLGDAQWGEIDVARQVGEVRRDVPAGDGVRDHDQTLERVAGVTVRGEERQLDSERVVVQPARGAGHGEVAAGVGGRGGGAAQLGGGAQDGAQLVAQRAGADGGIEVDRRALGGEARAGIGQDGGGGGRGRHYLSPFFFVSSPSFFVRIETACTAVSDGLWTTARADSG